MMGGSIICPGPLVVVEKGSWVEAPEVGEDPRPNALPPPRASLLSPDCVVPSSERLLPSFVFSLEKSAHQWELFPWSD